MDSATWREARPLVLAGTILLVILFLGLVALQIRQVLGVLFLGVVVGVALNPIVDAGRKLHVPRVLAVLLVYLTIGFLLSVFIYFTAREIGSVSFTTELDELRADYDELQAGTALPQRQELEDTIERLAGNAAGGLLTQALTVTQAIFSLFTILFTALLFTVTQERMRAIAVSFVNPAQRPDVESVLDKLAVGLRGFMRGEAIAMLIIGVVTYVGLTAIGIRLPLLLAFLAFLFEVLPLIGPWLAFFPALAIAATHGVWAMVAVSLLYLGIQSFENYIVTPLVHARESQMPALLIFVALLIGGGLMGLMGALIALPAAVVLHILFFEAVVPWNEKRLGKATVISLEEASQAPREIAEPG
jgi:predicted PurR-regulated permease PerM